MDLTQLANLGEFIGGVAVLVTLVYLAVQIRHNTRAVTRSTQQELWSNITGLSSQITQNADSATLILASDHPDRSLSPEDTMRFERFATSLLGDYESAYSQWLEGIFESKHWVAHDAYYRDQIRAQGIRTFWKSHKHWFFRDFVTYIDTDVYSENTRE